MSAIELIDLQPADGDDAVSFLAAASSLPKARIKDAMTKGAVWLMRQGRQRRLRRAKAPLFNSDRLSLYYDQAILEEEPPLPQFIEDGSVFSVWHKPAGLLCGGTRYGDHFAIDRLVERQLDRPTLLVHRLDRFVSGLMVLAHSKKAAANLSGQFESRETLKVYHARVHGNLSGEHHIETPVDGKPALSIVSALTPAESSSLVEVTIKTGRKHQIRAHLSSLGHPIIGDRQYGSDSTEDLQLRSVKLGFNHPVTGEWFLVNGYW